MRVERKPKFTPEVLIESARFAPLIPSPDGKRAFFTSTSYSIAQDEEKKEILLRNLETEKTILLSDDAEIKELQWLDGSRLLWLRSTKGGTSVWIGEVDKELERQHLVTTFDAPIWNVKAKVLSSGSICLAFCAFIDSEGNLFNAETAPKPPSSAREYDSIRTRFWDTWFRKERGALWYTHLEKVSKSCYQVAKPLCNVLEGTRLEFPYFQSSEPTNGGLYDLCDAGLIFDSIDLEEINPAEKMTTDLWFYPFNGEKKILYKVITPGRDSLTEGAKFSPNGKKFAFLKTNLWKSAAEHNSIFVVSLDDIAQSASSDKRFHVAQVCAESWDRSPLSLLWSNDGKSLYVTADDLGRNSLFKIEVSQLSASLRDASPTPLATPGSVAAVYPLSHSRQESRLVVNVSTMTDPAMYVLFDPTSGERSLKPTPMTHGLDLGLSHEQVSEFYIRRSEDGEEYDVQSWIVVPSNFQKNKSYPVAFLIHGGPMGAFADSWFTRWNSAVFAEQGYIVIMPNFSGSTGFGKKLTEGVIGSWGGRPYNDIVACFNFVRDNLSYADTNRAVALGGSYGGYMMYWIMGQPLAKEFKAMVAHDGIFSLASMLGSDVPVGLDSMFGSLLWDDPELWDKYDPCRYIKNWSTPMLVIHSDGDFRCPLNAGLAAFNTCQMMGIPSRLLNFPDENHFVLKRANSLKWHHTVLGWINHWTKNEGGVRLPPAASEP